MTILAALGDPKTNAFIGPPVTLDQMPRSIQDGAVEFTSDEAGNAIIGLLKKYSENTPLTSFKDDIELDIVLYHVLGGTHFPKRVSGGPAKVKLSRERADLLRPLPGVN